MDPQPQQILQGVMQIIQGVMQQLPAILMGLGGIAMSVLGAVSSMIGQGGMPPGLPPGMAAAMPPGVQAPPPGAAPGPVPLAGVANANFDPGAGAPGQPTAVPAQGQETFTQVPPAVAGPADNRGDGDPPVTGPGPATPPRDPGIAGAMGPLGVVDGVIARRAGQGSFVPERLPTTEAENLTDLFIPRG